MAYRVTPMLGKYRELPLLGASAPSLTVPFRTTVFGLTLPIQQGVFRSTATAIAPAPRTPVSSPTTIVVPAAPAPQPIYTPTIPPTALPSAPQIPSVPGSSPQLPTGGGGGPGGADMTTQPVAAQTAPEPHGMPGWLLPAAAGVAILMFMNARR